MRFFKFKKEIPVFLVFILIHSGIVYAVTPRCGTIALARERMINNSDSELDAPNLPLSRVSPSGRFEVHYATSGDDSTTEYFVDSALVILDYLWDFEIDSLGFRTPPTDYTGKVHVYLENLEWYYGATVPLATSGSTPSYIICENDFIEPVYATRGIAALKVTLAHEFFHVIQFGYRNDMFQLAYYEWFSTWMEEVAYGDVNDYLQYVNELFKESETSLFRVNGITEYSACIFIHLVDQGYSREIILDTWDLFLDGGNLFDNMILLLDDSGHTVSEVAAKYMAWCYYTGERAVDGFGFNDADLLTSLEIKHFTPWEPRKSFSMGEWGFTCVSIPGGIQGDPGLSVYPDTETAGVVGVGNGPDIHYLPNTQNGQLYGSPAFAGILALEPGVEISTLVVIPERTGAPTSIEISSVYPNPSSGNMTWKIRLDRPGEVRLDLFNILGRKVWEGKVRSGRIPELDILWDGTDNHNRPVAAGFYILRVNSQGLVNTKQIIHLNSGN